MMAWVSWSVIAFRVLELAVLAGAFLVVRRYQLTHPQAARLLTRALAFWAVAQMTTLAGPFFHAYNAINVGSIDRIDWSAALFNVGALRFILFQLTVSALYAWSLWLIAYAALAQPDRRAH
jgi:hypothetical protein